MPLSADLICHRCGAILRPGEGSFYIVNIEAFADPSPPEVWTDESPADIARDIDDLIESMRHLSEQELIDQVHRRLRIFLCGTCYARWIENPTG